MTRWAWAEVDLAALEHNVRLVRDVVAPAHVWAVVKADAYGHGAVPCVRAALAAGATGLCVALVQEGVELRDAGVTAPILVLSEQPDSDVPDLVRHGLTPTVYTPEFASALADAGAGDARVHLKVDTGMHRVGCDPGDAPDVADAITASGLRLDAVWTHLAVADEPSDAYTGAQLDRFESAVAALLERGHRPRLQHAANSAGALAHPRARRDLVRCGIAAYGISPGHGVDHLTAGLRPVLSLHARVSYVRRVQPGERISYGLRHTFPHGATVATVPIGYADGVPRRLSTVGGEVIVAGRRRPIVGVVTMDQLMVDVGEAEVRVGDPVVLLGAEGDQAIRAEEWADWLGTIGYEIVCGISKRVERRYRSAAP